MISTATVISALFDDDSQQSWARVDYEDVVIGEVCEALCSSKETDPDDDQRTRYAFGDGSAIVLAHGGWDLGFASMEGCFCWSGAEEHNAGCFHLA